MQSKLQRVEVQHAVVCDNDLAVEHAASRQLLQQRIDQLRKVTVQWFAVAALNKNLLAVTKDQRAKAIPFWFEDPFAGLGQFGNTLCQHRQHRRVHGQLHAVHLMSWISVRQTPRNVSSDGASNFRAHEVDMRRRTFALLSAVITFTAGVVLAKLWLPNLFKTPPPVVKQIQLINYEISGPYEYEILSIFLIHGPDAPNSRPYTPLQQAMDEGTVIVHETNRVNDLAIENLSDDDVFVQAGDFVKGGRQDRVVAVDFILPPNVGGMPVPAFCVEPSRWYRRGAESEDQFTLTEMSANYSLLTAILDTATQAGVWDEASASQERIDAGVAGVARSELSPTSLPLTLENQAVQESTAPYINYFSTLVYPCSGTIGFAYAINGELKSADVYSSKNMFQQLWPRLLKAAVVEAVATPPLKRSPNALPLETVGAFLVNSELGEETVTEVNPRTLSVKRETEGGLFFETRDIPHNGAWIHRSYLKRLKN